MFSLSLRFCTPITIVSLPGRLDVPVKTSQPWTSGPGSDKVTAPGGAGELEAVGDAAELEAMDGAAELEAVDGCGEPEALDGAGGDDVVAAVHAEVPRLAIPMTITSAFASFNVCSLWGYHLAGQ